MAEFEDSIAYQLQQDLVNRTPPPLSPEASQLRIAELERDRKAQLLKNTLSRKRTLSEHAQDVTGNTWKGIIGINSAIYGTADFVSRNNPITAALELAGVDVPSLDEATGGFSKQFAVDREYVQSEVLTDVAQGADTEVAIAGAEREAGKVGRIAKLKEEGYSDKLATVIDEAGSIASTAMDYIDNPVALANLVTEQIPQLLGAGVAGGLAKGLLSKNASAAALTEAGTAGAVGYTALSEGGTNAVEAQATVLKMTEKELFGSSDKYVTLRMREGMTHKQAQRKIADNVSDETYMPAALIGAIVSKVSGAGKFEGNLLGGKSAATKLKDALTSVKETAVKATKEAVEESVQGGVGQIASNVAIQKHADRKQSKSTGVGANIGAGALAGGASAGGTAGAISAVKGTKNAIVDAAVNASVVVEGAKVTKAAEEGIKEVINEPVETRNVNTVMEAIQKRNAVEGVTEEEHVANVAAGKKAIQESMAQNAPLQEQINNAKGKEQKTLGNQLDELQTQQAKALKQLKGIMAKEQAPVTEAVVNDAIGSGDTKTVLQSFRKRPASVSSEDATKYLAENEVTPEVRTEMEAHIVVEDAIKDIQGVSNDILNGSPKDGFMGIRNYQANINEALDAGDTKLANSELNALKEFADKHTTKSEILTKAFEGDESAIVQASQDYAIDVHPVKSKHLIPQVQAEVIALQAAVAQAEARIVPNKGPISPNVGPVDNVGDIKTEADNNADVILTPTQVESTEAKPVVDEASENLGTSTQEPSNTESFNLQEQALGSQDTVNVTLANKGFVKREVAPDTSPAALTSEPNIMAQLAQSPDLAIKYMNKDKAETDSENNPILSGKQKTAIKSMVAFDKNISKSIKKLFKYEPKYKDNNFIQYLADENGEFDPNVATAMAMSAYGWVMGNGGKTLYNTDEDINGILGRADDAHVSHELRESLQLVGSTRNSLVDNMGAAAMRSLGLSLDKDAPGNFKSQLESSLGIMAMTALLDSGYVQETVLNSKELNDLLPVDERTAGLNENTSTFFYKVATVEVDGRQEMDGSVAEIADSNRDTDALMAELFDVQSGNTGPSDTPNTQAPKKQKGTNQLVPEEAAKAIIEHQGRAHYIARDKMDKFLALDEPIQLEIMGFVSDPETKVMKRNLQSVIAKNNSIVRELKHMVNANEDFGDDPMYFTHIMWKNNRLGLQSNTFNPQGSKTHRHFLFQPTWKNEIQLGDSQQLIEFFTAFGESVGVKTDSGTWETYGPKIMSMIESDQYKQAAKDISEGTITPEHMELMEEGAYSYDGFINLARYYEAESGGSFTSDLFREVDGVTNGPIIGTLNLDAGIDHDDKTTKLERGGLFSDGATTSFGAAKVNQDDSYVAISTVWKAKMDDMLMRTKNAIESNKLKQAGRIFGDIKRNDAKSGLVQTVYGAADPSIKAGAASAFLDKFYDHITESFLAEDTAKVAALSKSINVLTGGNYDFTVDTLNTELSNKDTAKVTKYIEDTYGETLVSTIDESFSDFKAKGKQINTAMDIAFQSYSLMREAQIANLVRDKGIDLDKESLSDNDLAGIDAGLQNAMPIMHNYFSQKSGKVNEGLFVGKFENLRNDTKGFKSGQGFKEKPTGAKFKSASVQGKERQMISPGVSPTVLAVQSIDAATMIKHLQNHGALNVHDAIIVGQMDTMKQARYINKMFLDVQSEYSIMTAAYDSMVRSLDLLETYDPKLVEKVTVKAKGGLPKFIKGMQKIASEVDQNKAERMQSFTLASQYHVDGGETTFAKTLVDNPVKEIKKDGMQFSSTQGIDPENFVDDQTIRVDRMNSHDVFTNLAGVGTVREDAAHSKTLEVLLTKIVNKVIDPFTLHMQSQTDSETIGATNSLDMYIINQVQDPLTAQSGMLANGIRMSSQEVYLHELAHNISRNGIDTSSAATRRLKKLYIAAKRVITIEDFMSNPDLSTTDPTYAVEREAAESRFDHIFTIHSNDARGRLNESTGRVDIAQTADYLHEFVAFGMTNKRFGAKLATISPDLGADFKGVNNLLEMLAQVFELALDYWHKLTTAKGNIDISGKDQLDNLFSVLSGVQQQNKSKLLADIGSLVETSNAKLNVGITEVKKQVAKVARSKIFTESKSALIRAPAALTATLLDDQKAEFLFAAVKSIHDTINTGKQGLITSLVTELQGRTIDNGKFHDINRVANMTVDRQRNEIKTLVAEVLEKQFNTTLTEEQKEAIGIAALKTDLVSLMDGRTLQQVQEMLVDNSALMSQITNIQKQLDALGTDTHFYKRSAENLGLFMATGISEEVHLLVNAKQIAELHATGKIKPNVNQVDQAEILIDQLASLHAIQNTSEVSRGALSDVILAELAHNTNENGMTFMMTMHKGLKEDAQEKLFVGHNAMIKGYTKEIINPHIATQYAKADQATVAEMKRLGFTLPRGAKALARDKDDPNKEAIFMYINKHGGMNRFAAGAMSYTGKVAKGADTYKTRTQSADAQSGLNGTLDIADLKNAKQPAIDEMFMPKGRAKLRGTLMVPVTNQAGTITGYRYMMSEHNKNNILEKNNQYQDIMGNMAGSITDKVASKIVNEQLVDALKEQYDTDYDTREGLYLEVGPASEDKKLREIYYMMPDETRRKAKAVWGGDGTMYVKNDQLNLIFGYRKFSVTDMWHENPDDLNKMQEVAIQSLDWVFRGTAYSKIKLGENIWQEVVKDIKDIIVIKTGVVTLMNTLSNTVSLRMLGVPLTDIIKHQAEAFMGALKYQKDHREIKELEFILGANQRPGRRSLDQQRLAELKDDLAKNPVRELVESGVYQTIVEDIETTEGGFSYKSGFADKVGDLTEPLTSKLHPNIKTAAKFMYMSHDSSIYKTFNQAAVLSDFTARYALHKHYTTRADNRLSNKDSIAKIVSIFIDYDLPTHQGIQYANDMGLVWFSKYNFRVQRILMETMKENPARVIMLLAMQGLFGDIPDMFDGSILTHDMTNMVRNPVTNLDAFSEIAPINLTSSVF